MTAFTTGLPEGPAGGWPSQLWRYVYRTTTLLDSCAERFGDIFTLRLGAAGTLVVVHAPEHVKQVFSADAGTLLGGASDLVRPILGSQSIFVVDGPAHLRKRRLLSPPLHGERMRAYASLITAATDRAVDAWKAGQQLSIYPDMRTITLDVILRVVFGIQSDAQMALIGRALLKLFAETPAIFSFLPQVQVSLPGSPFWFLLQRRARVIEILDRLIAERRAQPDLAERNDILSVLLLARDEDGNALSDQELHDELITAVVAGHETTTTVLCWAFERILAHADVERQLRHDLAHAEPTSLDKLPILDAVLNEVMRQRPPFPLVARAVAAPFRVGGHELPVGVFVCPSLYLTHKRSDVFAEPERFDPSRWLGAKPDLSRFYPFGGGARRCLGMAFASFEMKLIIAAVLRRVRLHLAGDGPARVARRTVMLFPAGGTRVVIDQVDAA